jgi:hypothetical protein
VTTTSAFTSELYYEGRLRVIDTLERQQLERDTPFAGTKAARVRSSVPTSSCGGRMGFAVTGRWRCGSVLDQ